MTDLLCLPADEEEPMSLEHWVALHRIVLCSEGGLKLKSTDHWLMYFSGQNRRRTVGINIY